MGEQLKRSVQFRRDLEEGSMTIFQLLQLLWNDRTDAPYLSKVWFKNNFVYQSCNTESY